MHPDQRARAIAATIQQARPTARNGEARITARPSGPPIHDRACGLCGHRFTGDTMIVERAPFGRRSISERSVHYLAHGLAEHPTGDVLHGQPVVVRIDLADWERFLGLDTASPRAQNPP